MPRPKLLSPLAGVLVSFMILFALLSGCAHVGPAECSAHGEKAENGEAGEADKGHRIAQRHADGQKQE